MVPHQGERTEIGDMATACRFQGSTDCKKAADEAAAIDAEEKIRRGERVNAITRDFESLNRRDRRNGFFGLCELEASAGTLTGAASVRRSSPP